MTSRRTHNINIQFPPDLIKRLEEDAVKEERAMAAMVRYIVRKHYERVDAS